MMTLNADRLTYVCTYYVTTGLLTSVLWGLTVGSLGTWGVPQLMSAFPYCFTMGEATAVMHSCILFFSSVVANLPLRYHLPPIHDNDISTVLLQVLKRVHRFVHVYTILLIFLMFLWHIFTGGNIIRNISVPSVWMFSYPAQYKIFLFNGPRSLMFHNYSITLLYSRSKSNHVDNYFCI